MEEKAEIKKTEWEIKKTGWYAVAHFGADEKDSTPCFLKKIPYTNAKGETETSYHHFTYNMAEAVLLPSWYETLMAKKEVEARLEKESHVLKGHVKVIELAAIVVETPNED